MDDDGACRRINRELHWTSLIVIDGTSEIMKVVEPMRVGEVVATRPAALVGDVASRVATGRATLFGDVASRVATRRAALFGAALLVAHPFERAAHAGDDDAMAREYAAGARASGGRGANTMLKQRAASGVQRLGGDPLFKSGQIFDTVRSADGNAVDISFSFPPEWQVSSGPNLDVRNVRTSDSAFLLVAPLPKGKTVELLSRDFYTKLIFAPDGKYGAYGVVDDYSIKSFDVVSNKAPSGGDLSYRTFSLNFDALTYNQVPQTPHAPVGPDALSAPS